jgi:DNA-binding transcriptional regulator GbsR (MarR family)
MAEDRSEKMDVAEEFRMLGKNLQDALQTAWESEERKSLTRDILSGLEGLSNAVEEAAHELAESDVGQQVREEVNDLAEQVRKGEIADRLREDFIRALRKVNTELENITNRWTTPEEDAVEPPE